MSALKYPGRVKFSVTVNIEHQIGLHLTEIQIHGRVAEVVTNSPTWYFCTRRACVML